MTHNRFSDFRCIYTFIQFAHNGFIKVVCIEYSAFKSLSKMSEEQAAAAAAAAAAAVIIAIIFEKNKSRKKRSRCETGV